MRIIDTVVLPFCNVVIGTVPETVTSLDDLPDFLLPLKWIPKMVVEQETPSSGAVEKDAQLAIYFTEVKSTQLKGRQNDDPIQRFLKSPGMAMLEHSIQYVLTVVETRKLVRAYISELSGLHVHSFSIPPLTPKAREAMVTAMMHHTRTPRHIIGAPLKSNDIEERVFLVLGNGVTLFSKPHTLAAPAASKNRFRGVIGLLDSSQNFYIERVQAPSIFREFVTESLLQEAYANAVEAFENASILGTTLRLSAALDFVSDDEEMHTTAKSNVADEADE